MLRTLAFVAALALAAPAFAQSHADAMQRLAPFAGTYSLDGTAQVEEGSFDGTLSVQPILDGHFQQWDWTMTMRGDGARERVYLRFIAGYDAEAKAYSVYRFDSRDANSPTRVSPLEDPHRGTITFDGDALVMAWHTSNPNDPSDTGLFRNVVRKTSGGLHVKTNVKLDSGAPLVAIAETRATRN